MAFASKLGRLTEANQAERDAMFTPECDRSMPKVVACAGLPGE